MDSTIKSQILFVDDEENVLRGLARMLRNRRVSWDMRFASSGAQALSMIDEKPAAIVISDMRMPGMSGAELLSEIQKKHPGTIRMVLSGFAEREAVLKTIGPSHRYLAKPISEELLVQSIENALKLRSYLHAEAVQTTVAGLSHLPTLPDIYTAILAELNSDLGSAERLAAIIEKDMGTTTLLMKLTNSAYFSLPQRCLTVKQAVNVLGFDNIRAAVLLAGVFDQFKNISVGMADTIDRLMRRSLGMAVLAQAIARQENWKTEISDQAFCAALLSHVGTLLLIAHDHQAFNSSMRTLEEGKQNILDVENTAFGANHAQLGAYLLGLWGFSDPIVEAVAFHHQPSLYTSKPIDVLSAVHVAQYIARSYGHNSRASQDDAAGGLDMAYCDKAGLSKRLAVWREVCDGIGRKWLNE